jgi:hypothetical protein
MRPSSLFSAPPLRTSPLSLSDRLAVPLDPEANDEETCRSLNLA